MALQECLELRKRYVFKEAIAPWEKEVISDPGTPKANSEPFFYTPEGKSDVSYFFLYILSVNTNVSQLNPPLSLKRSGMLQHYFEMHDGVIHVYPSKDCK